MGAYFHYVNFDKRERFGISLLGGGAKFHDIGHTLAARAFEIMLTRPGNSIYQKSNTLCGRWLGDEVAVVGDDWDKDWEQIRTDCFDIGANVILMLMEIDGFDPIRNVAEYNKGLFMQLCHLATTGQSSRLEQELEQHFGSDFRRKYKLLCEEKVWFEPLYVVKSDS